VISIDIDIARENLGKDYKLTLQTAKKDEIHVFPDPPGTGKTKTFAKLIEKISDIKVLTLAPTHQLATETEKHYDAHLWGRDHFYCPQEDRFEATRNMNFNRMQVICVDCELKKKWDCEYLANINQALKSRTVISVHPYLSTTIPESFLKDKKKKCILVIDESPIHSLIQQIHITTKDLNSMRAIVDNELFTSLTRELIRVTRTEKSYYNKYFLRKFNCNPEYQDIQWDGCYQVIKRYNENIDSHYINNYIYFLKSIVELSIEFRGKNVSLPYCKPDRYIRKEHKSISIKEITYTDIKKNLPQVPIILFDATADKTLLEKIFPDRKIIMHNPNIKNFHIPYQITDGNYARKALSKEGTRNRIANAIYQQSKNLGKTDKIGLITHQINENYFKQKLIEMGVKCKIITEHYHNLLGINEFNKCIMLFIVGSPEPNPTDVKLYTEALHIGERPAKQKRRDKKYIDERVQRLVSHIRESHIIQAYGRARTLTNKDCEVFIFNNLELPIDTCELELNELIRKPIRPEDVALYTLYERYGDAPGNYGEYYDKVRNRHPFSDGSEDATGTIDWLESIGLLERRPSQIKITALGMKKVELFIENLNE
jgi:hypothetical protein